MDIGRRLAVLVVGAGLFVGVARGQEQTAKMMAKDAHPSFEVATIKPSVPTDQSTGFQTTGRELYIENETLESMIAAAYGVHPKQIVDAPDWSSKQRWDVKGVPDVEGMPSWPQYQEMIRTLLVERFGLKFHRDKRELPIFAVTVAKGGPKLAASKSDPDGLQDQTMSGNGVQKDYRFTNNSMAAFAQGMEYFMDRPVVDETGLKGKYDFELKWTMDGAPPQTDPNAPPGLFTAVQEQLGLKLEATKGMAEVLVIDHAEKPSAN
ncbi:MAG: TIGR03435 family protein [Acidobacteriaceae bacterium]